MKSRVLSVVFRFAKFGAQVGPELLSHVAEGVQQDVGAPDVEGVAQGALALRVVGVRNSSGHGVADDFRGIELKGATVTVVTKCGSWHTSCDATRRPCRAGSSAGLDEAGWETRRSSSTCQFPCRRRRCHTVWRSPGDPGHRSGRG